MPTLICAGTCPYWNLPETDLVAGLLVIRMPACVADCGLPYLHWTLVKASLQLTLCQPLLWRGHFPAKTPQTCPTIHCGQTLNRVVWSTKRAAAPWS